MDAICRFQDQTLSGTQTISRLKALALMGLRRRYPEQAGQSIGRLCRELIHLEAQPPLMQRMVLLWDLARYAREHAHLTAPGGWVLPASLAAYSLDITQVDPVGYKLDSSPLLKEEDPEQVWIAVSEQGERELKLYLEHTYPAVNPERVLRRDRDLSRMEYVMMTAKRGFGARPHLTEGDWLDGRVLDYLNGDGDQTFLLFRQGDERLRELWPNSIEELAAAGAFQVRAVDGPDPLYKQYLERRSEGSVAWPAETYGCILYIEQMEELLMERTGCSPQRAAQRICELRRAAGPLREPGQILLPDLLDEEAGLVSAWSAEELLDIPSDSQQGILPALREAAQRALYRSQFIAIALLTCQAVCVARRWPEQYREACMTIPDSRLGGVLCE